MKKLLALILAVSMCLSLVSIGYAANKPIPLMNEEEKAYNAVLENRGNVEVTLVDYEGYQGKAPAVLTDIKAGDRKDVDDGGAPLTFKYADISGYKFADATGATMVQGIRNRDAKVYDILWNIKVDKPCDIYRMVKVGNKASTPPAGLSKLSEDGYEKMNFYLADAGWGNWFGLYKKEFKDASTENPAVIPVKSVGERQFDNGPMLIVWKPLYDISISKEGNGKVTTKDGTEVTSLKIVKGGSEKIDVTADKGFYIKSIKEGEKEVLEDVALTKEVTVKDTSLNIVFSDDYKIFGAEVAAEKYTDENDVVNQKISVKGNFPAIFKNNKIEVLVNEGTEKFEGTIKEDGSFTVSDKTNLNGDVKVTANIVFDETTKKEILNESLTLEDLTIINNFTSNFKGGKFTEDTLTKEIETNGEKLSFDLTIYNKFDANTKKAVSSDLLKLGTDVKFENIKNKLSESVAKNSLYCGYDIASDGLTHYDKLFYNFSNDKFSSDFFNNTEENKKEIIKITAESKYNDFDEIKNALYGNTALTEMKNADFASSLKEKISHFEDLLDAETIKEYKTFNNGKKNKVCDYIYKNKNKINNFKDLDDKFTYVVTNYKKVYPDKKPSSGGGGGGGSYNPPTHIEIDKGTNKNENKPLDKSDIVITTTLNDLDEVPWAKDAVLYLFDKGVVSGRSENKFEPKGNIKRAEFIKILTGAFDLVDDNANSDFLDVTKDNWAYKYVSSGIKAGIINGISKDYFGPDNNITREDVSVLAYRILSKYGKFDTIENPKKDFTDIEDVSSYAKNAVIMLSNYGVISGYEDLTFKPKNMVTRAEASKIIYSLINYVKGE